MQENVITAAAGLLCTVAGFFFGLFGYKRSLKSDSAVEGRRDGAILTEIGYLKGGIDDIKRELKENDKRYVELLIRVQKLEDADKLKQ